MEYSRIMSMRRRKKHFSRNYEEVSANWYTPLLCVCFLLTYYGYRDNCQLWAGLHESLLVTFTAGKVANG